MTKIGIISSAAVQRLGSTEPVAKGDGVAHAKREPDSNESTPRRGLLSLQTTLPPAKHLLDKEPARPRLDSPRGPGALKSSLSPGRAAGRPSLRQIDAILTHAAARMASIRDEDGVWRTPYTAGPMSAAVGLLSLDALEVPNIGEEQAGVIRGLLSSQEPDGGYPITHGEGSSKAVTRVVKYAFELALAREDGPLASNPQLRAKVEESLRHGERFIEEAADTHEDLSFTLLADLIGDTLFPEKYDNATNMPLQATLARALIESGALAPLSVQIENAIIAPAILSSDQAHNQMSWLRRYSLLGLVSTARHLSRADTGPLAERLINSQDEDGGWMYLSSMAGMSIMALVKTGYDINHPSVKKGIEFIRAMRRPSDDGGVQQDYLAATTWDTGIMLHVLNRINPQQVAAIKTESLSAILKGQLPEGRWAFSLTGAEGKDGTVSMGDNDTTGMMLKVLSDFYATSTGEERAHLADSIRRGTLALLDQQQKDGGFGAFESQALYSFGDEPPSAFESLAIDASSPSVTGRVMMGLMAASATDIFTAEDNAKIGDLLRSAAGYLEVARDPNGAWWGRWISGYLPSMAFVLPPLKLLGVGPNDPTMKEARGFLLKHQNRDGGWGETIAADRDRSEAGVGPSTPVQTAFSVMGLITSGNDDDPVTRRAIERGVAYLQKTAKGSSWDNGRPLYTMSVGLEYYDAPEMTSAMSILALHWYRDYVRYGSEEAVRRGVLGSEPSSDGVS